MRRERHEFRATGLIRWPVLLALILWVGVGALAALSPEMPASTLVSVAFFVVFFLGFVTHYWRMAYVVDEYGVTYRGATDFVHVAWEDINEVRDSEMPLGGHYVSARGGGFVLSSFVRGHDKLLELIVARAGLFPIGS